MDFKKYAMVAIISFVVLVVCMEVDQIRSLLHLPPKSA